MADDSKQKTDDVKPAQTEQAISLPGAAVSAPVPGGWGGATSYIPTDAEKAEWKKIHDDAQAANGNASQP